MDEVNIPVTPETSHEVYTDTSEPPGKSDKESAEVSYTPSPEVSPEASNSVKNENKLPFPEKYTINNEEDVDKLITHEYPLSELVDFFGMDEFSDGGFYYIPYYSKGIITPDTVNEKFPIECTRERDNGYYTVYKVKEGGNYFVFWSEFREYIEGGKKEYSDYYGVGGTDYIYSIKNINDFSSLQPGISTYNDVIDIDPSTELIETGAEGSYSISLLDDNNVLVIWYSAWVKKGKGNEVIIRFMRIHEKTHGYLEDIYDFDLVFD